jgi:hypothetical protein
MRTASVYKGVTAGVAQAMRTADFYGVLDEDLGNAADPGAAALAATKPGRYVEEMRQIAVAQAFAQVYADVAATALAGGDPESAARDVPAPKIARRLRTR